MNIFCALLIKLVILGSFLELQLLRLSKENFILMFDFLWEQGLNYVAALLLLVMKTEEDAFWMLAVLLENVLVNDCYTSTLTGCHVEQRVFKDLLAQKCPRYFNAKLLNFVLFTLKSF